MQNYNPYNTIVNMGQFKCSTCDNIIWLLPKTQEEADTYVCAECQEKQNKLEETKLIETQAVITSTKGEESPQIAKQTSSGTGKKRRKKKNGKKDNKGSTDSDIVDNGNGN